ncbi:aspartate/glutamate racemase family protein [Pseudomonas sp. R3-52-08]|uniref:aspartate/glutamate racemase family protein n=1 Tax=Pseudomonas sp. R3-52-08 TaxID=1173284 RepID=UPI000F5717B2|nr:aspartate/glutamate racemase family protein [Pseudomonas sp. R3-52-08]AZF21720.1 Hydantoin racemase [Pseudomonas sp. R3-52-08]
MDSSSSNNPAQDVPVTVRWLNPIGCSTFDTPIAQLLHSIKQPSTRIEVVSFDMNPSPTHLEYRAYEALTYERIVRIARDCEPSGVDALVLGCFYDPALEDAREISGETLVVGPCQASLQVMEHLANRFSVIVGRTKWIEQMRTRVNGYGAGNRLASMRSLDMGVDEFQRDPALTRRKIIEQAHRAVQEDGAEAVILGCTIEFGFFEQVQREVGVPVIDPVVAAFKVAESMAGMKRRFGWRPSRVGSCEPPPEAEIARFGLFQGPAPIGNRVEA